MSEQQQVATEPERQNSSKNKPSLESYALAEQIATEEIKGNKTATLKQFYINLMNQLEIEGFPKEQISTIGKQIVIEKKSQKLKNIPKEEITIGSWWYDIAKEQGCIDPHYSHPIVTQKIEKTKNNFEQENEEWLSSIEKYEDFLKTQKSYLKNHHFNSLIPKKESNESLCIINSVVDHCNERLNNKTKIHPSHYGILLRDSVYSSGTKLSQNYYLHVKEKEGFTDKQSHKVVVAIMKDMPARYEPNTEEQSIACGFSGVPCPGCDSYRTEFVSSFDKVVFEDTKGNKYEHGIKVRRIKCYVEDETEYLAPMPKLPAADINTSEW